MSKHSATPWRHDKYGIRNVDGYICELRWPFHYERQDARFQLETAEREGDARLIAAAPDLLEALNECAKDIFELCEEQGYRVLPESHQKALAAITKATGEV